MVKASDVFFRDHLADPLALAQSVVGLDANETTHELVLRLALAQYGYVQAISTTARGTDQHGDGLPVDFVSPQFYVEGCYAQLFRIVERADRRKKPWSSAIPELKGFAPDGVVIARNERFEHLDSNLDAPISLGFLDATLQPHANVKNNPVTSLSADVDEFATDLSERLAVAIERLGAI